MNRKLVLAGLAIVAVLIVLTSLFFVSFTGNVVSEETKNVKIAYIGVVQGLPLYLAMEKGYFNESGITVEALKVDSPQLLTDTLVAGGADFGAPGTAAGITAIIDYKSPGTLQIFALIGGDEAHINDVLVVKKNSTVKSVEDLKGKNIGILPGIQFRTIAQHVLNESGIGINEVNIIELAAGLQVPALASGQVDAVLGLEPTRTIAINKGVGQDLVLHPMVKYISDPWYGAVGVVRGEFAKENPETTKKVIAVLDRAINEIKANPDEARKYLVGYTPLYENLIKSVPIPIFKTSNQITSDDVESLQKFFDIFTKYKVIDGKVDAKGLLYLLN
jgi:NitT/TauT family transport system substrate-binding protein